MAAPRCAAVRLLSSRCQVPSSQSGRCAVAASQVRHISARYSNPAKRSFTPPSAAVANGGMFVDTAASQGAPLPTARDPNVTRNPLDARQARLDYEERRQYYLRKTRFAAMGLLLSFTGLSVVLYNLDLDDLEQEAAKKTKQQGLQLDASQEANEKFQGKEVQVIGAGQGKRIVAHGQSGEELELVETGTSSVPHFPRYIYLPASTDSSTVAAQPNAPQNPGNIGNQEEYTLVGLGIRTVSFLSIQVYVVGMYIRTQDISTLQSKLIHYINDNASTLIPSEKEELRKRLLDPEKSRELWQQLLQVPGIKSAWRVSPTRNTDFGHLRDGWITGIQNRIREAKAALPTPGAELEYDSEEFGNSVQTFKSILAGGKAPKGSILILTRDKPGNLDIWFQENPAGKESEREVQHLGVLNDERISKLIWLGYLAGPKVSSEPARRGVTEGLVEFAGRPVGSVETMVH